jgi:xanthine dehydrogenase iron-sulfur cluster and FAD-binding subunit A
VLLRELDYARPGSVEDAVKLLAAREDARALAGGQSLVNVMKTRVAAPELVVDLNGIDALRGVEDDGGALAIGAMTTYAQIVDSPEVASARPILAEVARTIADVQVRNRGTIGGNVCSNDPTNHFPPLLSALEAEFTILGAKGERTVGADEFFEGVFQTAVHPGELLMKVRIPAKGDARDGWASVTLGTEGTGIVSVAACVSGGSARLAIGCVAATTDRRHRERRRDGGEGRGARRRPRPARRRARLRRLPPSPRRGARGARGEGSDVSDHTIAVNVNGERYEREVEARKLLVHFIRDDLDLTGTHVGCDTGNCGACTVLLDGVAVKSCMLLAPQADGAEITTVEGLAPDDGELTPLQKAFSEHHGLQCGYCTPGMLLSASYLLSHTPKPSDDEIRRAIQGNICRCTGYVNIVKSIRAASGQ